MTQAIVVSLALIGVFALVGNAFARSSNASSRAMQPVLFSTVIIDPGHGGSDAGGIPGQRVLEKKVALDVALRLRNALDRMGYRTVMTRATDTFAGRRHRLDVAAHYPHAIFVSIHFNSARRSGAHGFETYYTYPVSRPLAAQIQRRILCACPTLDRGVKKARFYVTRDNPLRAVLVECGFLTNPREAALATNTTYREKLAQNIAAGIQAYRASL